MRIGEQDACGRKWKEALQVLVEVELRRFLLESGNGLVEILENEGRSSYDDVRTRVSRALCRALDCGCSSGGSM